MPTRGYILPESLWQLVDLLAAQGVRVTLAAEVAADYEIGRAHV